MLSNKKIVQSLGEILKAKSIFNIIISPGSRNAPIIIHFTQHKNFKTYSVVDERCAAFFALGIAQQIRKPVVISCTSGSAVVNCYSAITEAFYQSIPLILVTADRPKRIIDVFEGQSIHQENIFQKHVETSIQLTEDESESGIWYNDRLMNQSINKCILKNKPIHINIPFSEPLYNTTNYLQVKPKIIKTIPVKNYIETCNYKKEQYIWKKYEKKMILLGLYYPGNKKKMENILRKLSLDPSIVIFTETTSHVYGKLFFSSIEKLIFNMNPKKWMSLKPHILLTIGINIISKKIKFFLRKYPPIYHWHIGEHYECYPDTYYRLTTYWPINPELFLKIFCNYNNTVSDYRKKWEKLRKEKIKKHKFFLKKEKSFSDLKVIFSVFKAIPNNTVLQLGNSMIVRYYQLFDEKKYSIKSYCNRGTSGIDGCVSTAVGSAMIIKKTVTLIVGDISFFYDSNALWNNYIPKNFRIILINNGGGNIFRFISEKKLPEKIFNFFETKHIFSAKKICEMHNWKYKKVSDQHALKNSLSFFWKKSNHPFLLEINTKKSNNAKILKKYLRS
ncbi:2-succinyl-5-enolpyruvyl-6-hydroxy-3-cyclohexene-1-carboxylic-acid synthase [Blattabacterium sp. (Blaberus giganteus)]|uniref:2-succinyl-5-enolpyruvyl-6-hydroxy-3- cyclohexene-1-carboxylic-acid synthase n=1 Tax=Blattabacterium sp. (Blaberus giganteus) TaxID=1186051 RepID=UPI00025F704C|nr:2-succinyl-5-enolpyruvyl-6-hydroxy-3-cyclohexene-1-carboxylic-acid synthase [Blattabacterium sp. (Blaberus giganteus)]AFJ90996.1 bifunctional 2-oxoglutarate decarboxylase/2-succinyl-5-enolpyruvyl-6-hydroxy-3- cyclohexene-1-carboxylate synthase [Blattabacterium sp. (Blaberus giganteus)]